MLQKVKNGFPMLIEALWLLVWLGLPLTSFPILGWVTNSQAAPFSAIPLAALIIIWFIPKILHGKQLPLEILPILGFALAAIISSAAIYYFDVIPFENRSFVGQSMRALFTLIIGLAFYLVISAWLNDSKTLSHALKWIHIGGAIMLLWGLMQTVIIFTRGGHFPPPLENVRMWLVIQYFAVREGTRVSGLSYEPSWFAHQLNMLYLPLWLAATYLKQSVFKIRIVRLTIENILLIFGLLEFLLSLPRVGLAALLLMLAFLFLKFNINAGKRLGKILIGRMQLKESRQKWGVVLASLLISISLVVLYIGMAMLVIYIGTKYDERMALLFKPIPKEELVVIKAMNENTLLYFGLRLKFLERVVYWLGGWHIFRDYPFLGVGLGNAGFLMPSHIPVTGWMTGEFRDLVYRLGYMINTKSYWIRILAETGLIGFSLFVTWLIGLWRSASYLLKKANNIYVLIGLAGQLALVAFIFEGMSLDSFALPFLWVTAALISAARMSASH